MKIKFSADGSAKLELIKLIRELTKLPLFECKTMIDNGIGTIEISDIHKLQEIQRLFEQYGAKIELIEEENNKQTDIYSSLISNQIIDEPNFEITLTSVKDRIATIKFFRETLQCSIAECNTAIQKLPEKYFFKVSSKQAKIFAEQANYYGFSYEIKKLLNNYSSQITDNKSNSSDNIYKINITDTGEKKIYVLKAIREITSEGLAECKVMIDKKSFSIFVERNETDIMTILSKLRNAGATLTCNKVKNVESGYTLYSYKDIINKSEKTTQIEKKSSKTETNKKKVIVTEINKPNPEKINVTTEEPEKIIPEKKEKVTQIIYNPQDQARTIPKKQEDSITSNKAVKLALISSVITILLTLFNDVLLSFILLLLNAIYIAFVFRKNTFEKFYTYRNYAVMINFVAIDMFIIIRMFRWVEIYNYDFSYEFFVSFLELIFGNFINIILIIASFIVVYSRSINKNKIDPNKKNNIIADKHENKQEKTNQNKDYKKSNEDFFKNKRKDLPF